MEKKKIIKICLMILGFFFVLAIIESSMRAIGNYLSKKSEEKAAKKKEEQIYQSDTEKTKREVKAFLNDVLDAIKDNDYQYVFDVLDETYKEYMFQNNINQLKEYLLEQNLEGEKYEINRVNQKGNMYQALVGIVEGTKYTSKGYTVKKVDSNRFALMFDEYTAFEKVDLEANYSNVTYQLPYYYETPELMGYIMDIQNKTDSTIIVEFNQAPQIIMTSGKKVQGAKLKSITIETGKMERTMIDFLKQSSGKSYINLNVIENNVPKEVIISLEKNVM